MGTLEIEMPAQAVTLHLPGPLYDQFEARAKHARHSLETELLRAVQAVGTAEEGLPPQLARAVRDLQDLDDAALWRVARDHLPREAAQALEALNHKQQREGLSAAEEETLFQLSEAYDRFLLLRAEAAGLLQERGHDISALAD